jgi:molecular chaperone IbpA
MNAIDFSPCFRTAIGFDRLARLMDTARTGADAGGYPPYNIEKTSDDSYVLTMAVAGFAEADLDHRPSEHARRWWAAPRLRRMKPAVSCIAASPRL